MTPNHDVDLKDLAGDWQAAPYDQASAEQIRRYVAKRTGLLWSFAVADVVIGAIALPVLVYIATTTERDAERLAMAGLASITVAAIVFGWWNRRGVWRASATSVADYVAISVERLRRMRMAWRIAWVVLAAEAIVFTYWIRDLLYFNDAPPAVDAERFAWGWLGGFTLAAVVYLVWFGRWLNRDEARFEALRRDLE
jgi:hypothetical protein